MADPRAWGIQRGFHDSGGTWREPSGEAIEAILAAMGASTDEPPPADDLIVTRTGAGPVDLAGRWRLHAEDGSVEPVDGRLADPPLGYHTLVDDDDGREVRLIVTPGRCHLPEGLRTWGWAVQLYAARSRDSWGMGDLGDLRRLAAWSAGQGAGMLLLNPLHAAAPVAPQQPSPYYASSRCFRNPLYIRVEDVAGASELGSLLEEAATAGRALNGNRRIDRDEVLRLKLDALAALWKAVGAEAGFDQFVEEGGSSLRRFATWCVLAEEHGQNWREWPAELQRPDTPEVAWFAGEHDNRVLFHQWLQFLVDRQLAAAGGQVDLMQDFAIGTDPAGADAWIWQDVMVQGVSVGAPPDEFNTRGQDWGLPPYDPWKLRAAAFQPFVETVRAGFRHAGGLRFDHVMGLFRLFWVPAGHSPTEGAYVSYPSRELLDILALESHRAGAYVVGEDLGTVEDEVREELARRDVLSYRLLWFEPDPPRRFPARALAAVTTHDLPTVAGVWTGADLEAQRERGMEPNEEGSESLRAKLRDWTGVPDDARVPEVVRRTYELLAEAPSALLAASLDDALEVIERPNYPGTVDGTNWSLALPLALEEIEDDPEVAAVAEALNGR